MKTIFWWAGAGAVILAGVVAVIFWLRPIEVALPEAVVIQGGPLPDATSALSVRTPAPEATPAALQPAGEESISEILVDAGITHEQAARKMLALLPRLSEDDQEEAAHHIANLSDEAVAADWARKLQRNQLPKAAAEVLFAALYNQPEELFLPTAAAIADVKGHPFAQESADTLEILVGPLPENTTWSAHVARELRDQQATP